MMQKLPHLGVSSPENIWQNPVPYNLLVHLVELDARLSAYAQEFGLVAPLVAEPMLVHHACQPDVETMSVIQVATMLPVP